jgi:hypothetical protein
MSDLPIDLPTSDDVAIEQSAPGPQSDDAAFETVWDLIKLIKDAGASELRLGAHRRERKAIRAERKALAEERAALAADKTKQLAEIAAERDVVTKRLLQAQSIEQANEERHKRIVKLELAWRNLGEPDSVQSGFQSPQYSGLEKARRAHQGQPVTEHSPPSDDAVARAGATIDEDPQGQKFPAHVTLTRTPEQPPAAARARPGRRGVAHAE